MAAATLAAITAYEPPAASRARPVPSRVRARAYTTAAPTGPPIIAGNNSSNAVSSRDGHGRADRAKRRLAGEALSPFLRITLD